MAVVVFGKVFLKKNNDSRNTKTSSGRCVAERAKAVMTLTAKKSKDS